MASTDLVRQYGLGKGSVLKLPGCSDQVEVIRLAGQPSMAGIRYLVGGPVFNFNRGGGSKASCEMSRAIGPPERHNDLWIRGHYCSCIFDLVGVAGFRLNPALTKHLAGRISSKRHESRQPLRRQHRLSRRLDAEQVEQLAAEYMAGSTAAELGRRYGIAKSSVLTLLRSAGVPIRYPRLSEADVSLVVALYREGMSQTDIASRVRRSPGAVWHVLERAGLVGRP